MKMNISYFQTLWRHCRRDDSDVNGFPKNDDCYHGYQAGGRKSRPQRLPTPF